MSTVYSDIGTKQNDPGGEGFNEVGIDGGRVRVAVFEYEAAALETASLIRVTKLYPGDRVLLGGSFIMHDAMGSGVTFALGDDDDTTAVDADRYLEATAASSAGVIHLNDAETVIAKVPYKIQKECWLVILTADIATGTIKGEIFISGG